MTSIQNLIDMVATEAAEGPTEDECGNPIRPEVPARKPARDLPPIDFQLELMVFPDGGYIWVDSSDGEAAG